MKKFHSINIGNIQTGDLFAAFENHGNTELKYVKEFKSAEEANKWCDDMNGLYDKWYQQGYNQGHCDSDKYHEEQYEEQNKENTQKTLLGLTEEERVCVKYIFGSLNDKGIKETLENVLVSCLMKKEDKENIKKALEEQEKNSSFFFKTYLKL